MSEDLRALTCFLIEAKRHTYAGLDDDATVTAPLLLNSKQLEHRAGPYAYRDIYFGMRFFVGQETVTRDDHVVWSMCYSGGARAELADPDLIPAIYKFLRHALLAADVDLPYRGPASFTLGEMTYRNSVEGTLSRFHGVENIHRHATQLYELRYSGGLLQ